MKEQKRFLTYEQQLELLKKKKLKIPDEEKAIVYLKRYSYYSLISGYKDIFKVEKNGNYRSDANFNLIVQLYVLDSYLRNLFLKQLISIEKNMKSLYSYAFCEVFGDSSASYLNATNYDYTDRNQDLINEYLSIVNGIIKKPDKFPNINYNIQTYGSVPLWIILHSLSFGNISKLYSFSKSTIQSKIAREFKSIYSKELSDILNVLTKFRNVCAHGERLYNYKTIKSLPNLPLHSKIKGKYNIAKNDLFNVCICFKYLLPATEFSIFIESLSVIIDTVFEEFENYYNEQILNSMGFPYDWKEILSTNFDD